MEWRRNTEEARRQSLWCHSETARKRDSGGDGEGGRNRVHAADERVKVALTGLGGHLTVGQGASRGSVKGVTRLGGLAGGGREGTLSLQPSISSSPDSPWLCTPPEL